MADATSADSSAGDEILRDVVLITDQRDVIDTLITDDDGAYSISSELTVDGALKRDEVHGAAGVLIYDVDTVNGDSRRAVDDLKRIHRDDPSKVIILIGPQEPLNAILKTRVRPVVYRVFNKPISRNQMKLCLGSAQALHHELLQKRARGENIYRIDGDPGSVARTPRRSGLSPLVAGLAGLLLVAPVAYFLLTPAGEQARDAATDPGLATVQDAEAAEQERRARIEALLQSARQAVAAERLILPEGDNALHYFNEALRIDPYNAEARDGKQALSTTLLARFRERLDQKQFDEAMSLAFNISRLDPRNRRYQSLQAELQSAMNRHLEQLQADDAADDDSVRATSATVAQVQSELVASGVALQREAEALDAIQDALDGDRLIPPATDNAFDLLAAAAADGSAADDSLLPFKAELSRRLLERATAEVEADRLDAAGDYAEYANALGIDSAGIERLERLIVARLSARSAPRPAGVADVGPASSTTDGAGVAAESAAATPDNAEPDATEQARDAGSQVARIVPTRIVKRVPPEYPQRALQRRIEGWVDVSFTVSTEGRAVDIAVVDSEPPRLFDRYALRAVQQWEFEPARDETSGTAFESRIDSFRVSFQVR